MHTQKVTVQFEWHNVQGITEYKQGVFPIFEAYCIVVIKTFDPYAEFNADEYDDLDYDPDFYTEYRTEMAFLTKDFKWYTHDRELKEDEEVIGWAYIHEVVDSDVFSLLQLPIILEFELTGRKLYTVWYRDDFYVQIGIDWDFPGIKDRIVSVVDTFLAGELHGEAISDWVLDLFLKTVADEFSQHNIGPTNLKYTASWLFISHKLRLDGKDGITLCNFKIPKWPKYVDFEIKNIEDCKDPFSPDNRITKDIYDPMGIEPSY